VNSQTLFCSYKDTVLLKAQLVMMLACCMNYQVLYTVSQKTVKIVFGLTLSNFHQPW